ncbi:MAG TPA: transglycosylase SLT domain-containing protein [Bdellovibrionota bacterium]|jgi:soluble lytic murein transglycosylase|nr:transglycosylase SLT domain-containing protein [Bdellovibrionota bacterium]
MDCLKYVLGWSLVACTTTSQSPAPLEAERILSSTPDPIERAKSLSKREYQESFAEGFGAREQLLFRGYFAFLNRDHDSALTALDAYLMGAKYNQDRRYELSALKAIIETHRALIMQPEHRSAYVASLKSYVNVYSSAKPLDLAEAEALMDVKLKLARVYATDGDLGNAEAINKAVAEFRTFDSPALKLARFDAGVRLAREIAAGRKHFAQAAEMLKKLESEAPTEAQLLSLRFYQGFYLYLTETPVKAVALFNTHRKFFEASRDYKFRASYWKALALLKIRSKTAGENLLTEIVQKAPYSYYGQLAVMRLRKNVSVAPHRDEAPAPIPVTEFQRAQDLNTQKRFVETFALLTQLSPADDQIPGSPLLSLYYPQPFLEEFKRAALEHKLETETLLGLARQESAFQEKVVTFDFGYGIMQIQAEKAALIANKTGDFRSEKLLEAAYNIDLGAAILRESLDHFHGKTYLAAAAYNAGIPSVESWLKRRHRNSIEEFIEDIPFEGTGKHVRNVLKNRANYSLLYRGSLPSEYF